ncbi:MAG: hypothetical protein ABI333_09240 [bacterium]
MSLQRRTLVKIGVYVLLAAIAVLVLRWLRARDSDWVRRSYKEAKASGSLLKLVEFIDDHPRSQRAPKARTLIARRYGPVLAAHEKRATPGAGKRFFTELLGTLRQRRDPRVTVVLTPPDAKALADTDQRLSLLSRPTAPVARLSEHFLGKTHYVYQLTKGANAAFKKGLGIDAVVFRERYEIGDRSKTKHKRPTMTVQWKVRASRRLYARTNVRRSFAGIVIEAAVVFRIPGRRPTYRMQAVVEPAKNFQFSTSAMRLGFASGSSSLLDSDVYGGMAKSAFGTLGQKLLADLTGIAPPAEEALSPAEDTRLRCERDGEARACARFGHTLMDPKSKSFDDVKAFEVLKKACGYGRGCADLARLHLRRGGDMARASAVVVLMDGCLNRDAEACRLWAEIELVSDEVKTFLRRPPAEHVRGETVRLMVKGCDLGSARACGRAAQLFLDPRNATKDSWIALIFARRGCAASDRAACGLIQRLTEGTGHAKPTASVLGARLPKGARLFDVRYRVHYESHPELCYWVALAEGQQRVPSDRYRITQDVFGVADPTRPTTVRPPGKTKRVARLTPWRKGRQCGPCHLGLLGALQSSCDCPNH